jgi:MtN3 and saliva related transmembrane protein
MTETVLAVAAAVWGLAMGLSPLLQVRRMRETRSSRDVSVPYFLVLNVGFLLWFAYGVASSNLTVALPNIVAFSIGTVTIVIALRLRRDPVVAGQGNGAGSSSSSVSRVQ